jgi:hypothetical protein
MGTTTNTTYTPLEVCAFGRICLTLIDHVLRPCPESFETPRNSQVYVQAGRMVESIAMTFVQRGSKVGFRHLA